MGKGSAVLGKQAQRIELAGHVVAVGCSTVAAVVVVVAVGTAGLVAERPVGPVELVEPENWD